MKSFLSSLATRLLDWIAPVLAFLVGRSSKERDYTKEENAILKKQISNDVRSVADADRVWDDGDLPGAD